jgi:hypothetical protein
VASSPKNLQLRDQAVLIWRNLAPLTEIGVVVDQPAITDNPEICVYTSEELARAEKEMWDRVIASNTPGQRRTPGKVQCHFCKARLGNCAEYQQWAGAISPPALLTVLGVPMVNWTPEQRAMAADALAPAGKLLEDIKENLKEFIRTDPASVPGWGLSNGVKREEIKDPQKCFERFGVLGGKLEQFMGCIKVKKAALKEAVHEVTSKKGKALDTAMKELTLDIVEVTVSEPSLKKLKEDA